MGVNNHHKKCIIVSNASLSAQEYSRFIRHHWFVENKMHYVKDVSFQEDKTVKRVNPFIFFACIDFSLNRLRKNKDISIKQKIYQSSLDVFSFLKNNKYFNLTSTP
jgi:predicted transposase YbfD/YdcC